MKCKVVDFLEVQTEDSEIIEVQSLKIKYEPGIVDDSDYFAVVINGKELMISEEDLDTLEEDMLK